MLLNRWSVVAVFPQFPQFSHWVFNTSRNKASLRLASHRIASGHAMSAMIRASFFTYVIIAFNCTGQEPGKQTENKKENRQTRGQTDRRTGRHAVLCWPDRWQIIQNKTKWKPKRAHVMWVEWEVKGQEREGEIVWWRRVLISCSGGGPWRPLETCTQVLSSFFLVEGKATCCGVLTSFDLDALIAPPSLSRLLFLSLHRPLHAVPKIS